MHDFMQEHGQVPVLKIYSHIGWHTHAEFPNVLKQPILLWTIGIFPGGVLNKVPHGEALPLGSNPYPLV